MGRRGSCVRSSLSSLSFPPSFLLLPPEKYPARISPTLPRKSNVKRSVRRIERVPGKSAFPGFFVSDKTMAAIDERWKGSGVFKPARKLKRRDYGWGDGVRVLLTFERKGKSEKGRVFDPTCRGFSASSFPRFFSKLCRCSSRICRTD